MGLLLGFLADGAGREVDLYLIRQQMAVKVTLFFNNYTH